MEYYPEFNPTMETEEFEAMRKKHSKGYDNLTIEEKRHLIRNEVKQNEHNPEVWDKFLKFEVSFINLMVIIMLNKDNIIV